MSICIEYLNVLRWLILMIAVSAFTDYIKSLSPSTLDMELRMLQIIDDDDIQQEVDKRPEFISIELLLDYFIHEIACRNNFEFIQAVIRLFLKVKSFLPLDVFSLVEKTYSFLIIKLIQTSMGVSSVQFL